MQLFDFVVREIRTFGIHSHRARERVDNQIHIFHRHCAKERLITHYQRTDKTEAVLKHYLNRTDVWHFVRATIGGRHIAGAILLQRQLAHDMFWQAKHNGPGIDQAFNL